MVAARTVITVIFRAVLKNDLKMLEGYVYMCVLCVVLIRGRSAYTQSYILFSSFRKCRLQNFTVTRHGIIGI